MLGRVVRRRESGPELASQVVARLRRICRPAEPPRHRAAPVADAGPEGPDPVIGRGDGAPGFGGWVPAPRTDRAVEPRRPVEPERTEESVGAVGPVDPGDLMGPFEPRRSLSRGHLVLVVVALLAAVLAATVLLLRSQPVAEPVALAAPQAAAGRGSASPTPGPTGSEGSAVGSPGAKPTPPAMLVDVAGKVREPGVVRLPAGSRVEDAVEAAGGALPKAEIDTLNLARPLVDGEQILVGVTPPSGQAASGPAPGAAGGTGTGAGEATVDLNTAGPAELEELPGVGPVLAQRILDYRTLNGPFTSAEELLGVSGIGERTLADMRDHLRVP